MNHLDAIETLIEMQGHTYHCEESYPANVCECGWERVVEMVQQWMNSQRGDRSVNDTPNLDDLRHRIRALHLLLEDAHPGLSTWREAYEKAVKNVLDFYEK